MIKFFSSKIKVILILTLFSFYSINAKADETEAIIEQLKLLQEDIKTLEKAVYSDDVQSNFNSEDLSNEGNDILTKHLLKLSELEEQFKTLTNNFEEINFKLDKLSNRITKVQTDNQMRFQDLEKSGLNFEQNTTSSKKEKLPGSDEAKDLGGVSDDEVLATQQVQVTQSIDSVGSQS